ncbi:MAG: hypothetical protein KAY59_08680 [Acidobacteria bacterium]|nr:hypothetical protein [Acidobacteriota bacterium]
MIGSLLIGVAIWCAAGTVAVASPDSATARLVVAAPWWMFVIGTVIGAAVPTWRKSPLTTLPALLAVLPWLPIPLPAIALIWTGPMAWVAILAALAFAVGLGPARMGARIFNLFDPDDATVAAFVLAAVLGGLGAWATNARTPTGDEPHYLIITQSLLKDGDLDLDNNHQNRDYASFFGGDLAVDLRQRGVHGEGYSIHAPGVSTIVAPVFQFFGYTGARIVLILLTALGAMLTWRLCWRVTDSAEAAWMGWAAVIITPTFALQSFMVYPDAPGMLVVAAAALLLVQLSRGDLPGLVPVTLTGVALASLPWLHTRFAVLAATLGAAIGLRLLMPATRDRLLRLVALLIVPVVSAVLWFVFFKVHYGTFDPRAPYGPEAQSLAWVMPAILALFFDGQYGLATYGPAVALACAGWWRQTGGFTRRLAIELAVIVFGYLIAVSTVRMWWAGNPATPARFMMSLLPLLAVPVAVAWTRFNASARALAATLVAVGAGLTTVLLSVDHAALAWNYRWANAEWLEWISPVVNLSRAWPAFFWQESRFPLHVILFLGSAVAIWMLTSRLIKTPRTAVLLWAIVTLSVVAPAGWAFTHAMVIDPARAQLNVIRAEGEGRRVFAVGAGRVSRLRSLRDTMTLRPLEPGPAEDNPPPPLLLFADVPAARYIAVITSTSNFPVAVRLYVGRSDSPWREFTVPGQGTFTFPFVVPAPVSGLMLDADPAARPSLRASLTVEDAMPAGETMAMRSAAHYGSTDVLFLDDQVYVETPGFWVKGRQAAKFVLVPSMTSPVSPLTVRVLVRNGAALNTVTIESGTFQRLLTLTSRQEVEIDIPLTPAGTASVRVASGSGFSPADIEAGNADRRLLGVWIQPR